MIRLSTHWHLRKCKAAFTPLFSNKSDAYCQETIIPVILESYLTQNSASEIPNVAFEATTKSWQPVSENSKIRKFTDL